jgi:hypothetical protein
MKITESILGAALGLLCIVGIIGVLATVWRSNYKECKAADFSTLYCLTTNG